MRIWVWYARRFGGARRLLALSVAGAVVQSALLVPAALLVRRFFDDAVPSGRTSSVVGNAAAMLGLFLASTSVALGARYAVIRATKHAVTALRDDVFAHVVAMPRPFFDARPVGTLHATVVQDSERVDGMSAAVVAQLLPATVVSLVLAITLAVLDPVLFALLLVAIPAVVLVSRPLAERLRRRTRLWQRAFDAFSTDTLLALRGATLTITSGADDALRRKLGERHAELAAAGRAMAWLKASYLLANGAIGAAVGFLVLVAGGIRVAHGSLTVGGLLAVVAVMSLLRAQALTALAAIPEAIAGRESLARLRELAETPSDDGYRGTRRVVPSRELAAAGVAFAYANGPRVLEGVDFRLGAGERVALVGPNGAGKSTLVHLLLGLYTPSSGTLRADGVAFDELDVRLLRRHVGFVPQDPLLFPESVAANVARGAAGADRAAAAEALELVGLSIDIDAVVGDDGLLLSGGRRQLVAIARALVARPRFLLLDEPTTFLDRAARERLFSTLDTVRDCGVLIITHDAAVEDDVDRVVVLRDGRVAEAVPA